MNRVVVVVCAAGLALACQTQEQATEQGSETSPVVDAAGAREAMAAIDQAWEEAALAGDAAALTALYTADAVVQAPGYPRVSGTAGIQRYGVAMWSGDVGARFGTVAAQQRAQLHMSLSGID